MHDEDVVVDDRRAAIEAAFNAEEEKTQEVAPPEQKAAPVVEEKPTASPQVEEEQPANLEAKGTVPPAPPPETTFSVEKAPQSWRAPQRAKWEKLDPDVRQEIMRRERETTKVLGETANARQFQSNFNEVVQPFQARIQSLGVDAMTAVHELLKADYLLSSAPKLQRAQYMARLIQDYGVDIAALDSALAGVAPTGDAAVSAQVEQLLQQRLAPFQQYIQTQ